MVRLGREKPKQTQLIKVRQVQCYRTWYENTTKARQKNNKNENQKDKKKPTGVVKNVMQDQKGCKKIIRAGEEQITAAQTKQHEDEEEHTGLRPGKTNKQIQTKSRSSEYCDAIRSERNISIEQKQLHGRNNSKTWTKIPT